MATPEWRAERHISTGRAFLIPATRTGTWLATQILIKELIFIFQLKSEGEGGTLELWFGLTIELMVRLDGGINGRG